MKVSVSKSKNATIYYLSKSVRINGRVTTKTIEKIGSYDEIKKVCGDMEPLEWAKQYAAKRSAEEKASKQDIVIKYSSSSRIRKDVCRSVNIGYLFLKDIYYDLRINSICTEIAEKYKFEFDLNDILSMLVFARVIYPGSKRSSLELLFSHESFTRDRKDPPLNCPRSFLKNPPVNFIRFTGRWRFWRRRMTISSRSFIRIQRK